MAKRFNAQFVRVGEDNWEPDAYFYELEEAITYVTLKVNQKDHIEYGQVLDISTGMAATGLIIRTNTKVD